MPEYENDILNTREHQYGDPVEMHDRIASIWSGILGTEVSGYQVALCMAGLKLARATKNANDPDSLIDAHGYTEIAQMIQKDQQCEEPNDYHYQDDPWDASVVVIALPLYLKKGDAIVSVDALRDIETPIVVVDVETHPLKDEVLDILKPFLGECEHLCEGIGETFVKTEQGEIWSWMVAKPYHNTGKGY